jgi:SET family sugar efflux transporter-like MFS transporter
MRATPALVRVLWDSRLYRSSVISLFIAGIGVSAANPQLTLFLVNELGASLPVAGLFYLTNLTAPLLGFLMGYWSDRRPDRLSLFRVGAVAGTVGWLAMAAATRIWMPFLISVLALGVAGTASAQIFAAVRDELNRRPTASDNRVISSIRMSFTCGWIVGPVAGSWFGAAVGLRPLLVGVAACTLAQLLPFLNVRAPRYIAAAPDREGDRAGREPVARNPSTLPTMLPLLAFTALCVIAISGDTIKFAYLPLYMDKELHASAGVRGAVISIQPFFELLLIPVFGHWADRLGAMRLVIVGVVLGIAANAGYALSTNVTGLFVAQSLMAGLWAAIAGLGINVAQHLYPHGVGVASSTFLSSIPVAASLGGLVGSLGVARLGLPGVFYLPAALCCVSGVGLLLLARRFRGSAG